MPNPLFNALGGAKAPMDNNFINMVKQFNNFKNNFQGDPKQMVQSLLNSGKMSQEQYNQLQGMAKEFMNILNN